jgi:hypothetical protein
MYWKITHDILDHNTEASQVGLESGKRKAGEEMVRFTLKDCDGNTYYRGIMSADGQEEEIFEPLRWAAAWAGATRLYINGEIQ